MRDTNLEETDNTYLAAALGTALPDVEDIATALAYTKVAATKPLSNLRIQFNLTQSQTVSIGYVTTQPDGTPGKYCNVRAFNLYVNY